MTNDEALNVIDQVGALSPVNRQAHLAFQEAVTTLRVALTKEVEPESPSRDGAKEETVVD